MAFDSSGQITVKHMQQTLAVLINEPTSGLGVGWLANKGPDVTTKNTFFILKAAAVRGATQLNTIETSPPT